MAWYTTGTIAVSGTTVTGTGTNFLDNTQSIGPGQALLIPGSGTVKMYEVASVQSATKLTLKTSAGTVAAGQAYAILSFYTDSVPDFARRLAAQLSYYQSQMDGWQQIMTGTGSITMTAPDGTTVTISSFSKLTTDVANTLKLPTANSSGDVGSLITPGVYSIPSSMTGAPIASNGVLMVTAIASGNSVVQDFTCTSTSATNYGRVFRRVGTIASGATTWTDWASQNLWHIEASSIDLNTYIRPGTYAGGSFVNGPSAMGTAVGFMIVLGNVPGLNITQQITYVASGRTWTRTSSAGTWTAWTESLTTNSTVALANGGTGATTAAGARTNLGLTAAATRLVLDADSYPGEALLARGAFGLGTYISPNGNTDGRYNEYTGFYAGPGASGVNYFDAYAPMLVMNRYQSVAGYLQISPTNGKAAVRGRNGNTYTNWLEIYTTGNTTKASDGTLKAASPVIRIARSQQDNQRADIAETGFTWCGCGTANDEATGVSISRLDAGKYVVTGSAGLASEGWQLLPPRDPQGSGDLGIVEAEQTESGGLTISLYKRRYKLTDDGDIEVVKGDLIDVPVNSWIDVRLDMPSDSAYNLKQAQMQQDAEQDEESGS